MHCMLVEMVMQLCNKHLPLFERVTCRSIIVQNVFLYLFSIANFSGELHYSNALLPRVFLWTVMCTVQEMLSWCTILVQPWTEYTLYFYIKVLQYGQKPFPSGHIAWDYRIVVSVIYGHILVASLKQTPSRLM